MENPLEINLEVFPERFSQENRKLLLSRKGNFIFGKNGTGKTTITEAIKSQKQNDYRVYIFDGFEGIVGENKRLDAVALGTENAEVQKKIDAVDIEIENLKKEIDQPIGKSENLFTKLEGAKKKHEAQFDKIEKFYSDSAQGIKNQTTPQIAKPTYDKNAFRKEIHSAQSKLSEDEIKKYKGIIRSVNKNDVTKTILPNISSSDYQESINIILQSKVDQQQIISELQDDADKQNFAREGLRIHKHEDGEKCAFCGNDIKEERWKLLGGYFNDKVKKLEASIDDELRKISDTLDLLKSLEDIKKSIFYDQFSERIENINLRIKTSKGEYEIFLENLKKALQDKKKNLFTQSNILTDAIPVDFSNIQTDYEQIVSENNNFSRNLTLEQENAKKALRFHEIKRALDVFEHDKEKQTLSVLKDREDEVTKEFDDRRVELDRKQAERNDLILQTKDEVRIAREINNLLKSMGVSSFTLELVDDSDEQQRGQYKIKSYSGDIRHITELSKGEKNIIAFLYFVLALKNVDGKSYKPKIIILDDPMTSNDDTMQYLMTNEIQELYKNLGEKDYFLLLTHNIHFYLNARKPIDSFYKKYGNFHLFSDGKLTTIKAIENGGDDFKTNYGMLWKELLFLYENNKPDLMLSSCRRICETFVKFNCVSDFYKENLSVKKLFDVNQHSIDDLEAEQNGKTRDEIVSLLRALFVRNNASEHFDAYWKKNS